MIRFFSKFFFLASLSAAFLAVASVASPTMLAKEKHQLDFEYVLVWAFVMLGNRVFDFRHASDHKQYM